MIYRWISSSKESKHAGCNRHARRSTRIYMYTRARARTYTAVMQKRERARGWLVGVCVYIVPTTHNRDGYHDVGARRRRPCRSRNTDAAASRRIGTREHTRVSLSSRLLKFAAQALSSPRSALLGRTTQSESGYAPTRAYPYLRDATLDWCPTRTDLRITNRLALAPSATNNVPGTYVTFMGTPTSLLRGQVYVYTYVYATILQWSLPPWFLSRHCFNLAVLYSKYSPLL